MRRPGTPGRRIAGSAQPRQPAPLSWPGSAGPVQLAGWLSCTVTDRTVGASVTVPVFSSTVPALACAMLPTKAGSWKSTGPAGA